MFHNERLALREHYLYKLRHMATGTSLFRDLIGLF